MKTLPNQLIDPKRKTEKYYLEYAKAIYDAWKSGKTFPSSTIAGYLQELREYGYGKQNVYKYIEQFERGLTREEIERKGYKNISRHLTTIMSSIRTAIHNALYDYEEEVFVNNIDEDTRNKELDKMYETLVEIKERDWFKNIMEEAGIDISDITNYPFPNSITTEELELFYKIGGFKLNYARIAEKLLRYTEQYSKWEDIIKHKLIDDLIDFGFAVAKVSYDEIAGKVKYEYVNPLLFGIQKSSENDFSDAEFAIMFRVRSISSLRQYNIPEEKLREIAYSYCGKLSNPPKNLWDEYNVLNREYNDYLYSNFKVLEAECVWIDTDIDRKLKYTNIYGKTKILDVDFDYQVNLSEKQKARGVKAELVDTYIRTVKFACWIVDTDIVYKYGKYPNQIRKNPKEPVLPFVCYRMFNDNNSGYVGSLVENLVPYLDGFANAWVKFQNIKHKAVDWGIMVNLRLLANLKMNGKDISEAEAIKMFKSSGILPYMDIAPSMRYEGGDVLPIKLFEGNLGILMREAIEDMEYNIRMITRISGINVDLIQNYNQNDISKETFKMYYNLILTSIKSHVNSCFYIKKKLAENALRIFKIILVYDEFARQIYSNVIGQEDLNTFLLGILDDVEYGIFLETRASEEEKLRLLEMAKQIMTRVDAETLPNFMDTYLYIENLIYSGVNIKEIKMRLMFAVKRTKEELEKRMQERYKQTAEANAYPVQLEMQKQAMIKELELKEKAYELQSKQSDKLFEENIKYLEELEKQLSEIDGNDKKPEVKEQELENNITTMMGLQQQNSTQEQETNSEELNTEEDLNLKSDELAGIGLLSNFED